MKHALWITARTIIQALIVGVILYNVLYLFTGGAMLHAHFERLIPGPRFFIFIGTCVCVIGLLLLFFAIVSRLRGR
jgi:hypothetical protein